MNFPADNYPWYSEMLTAACAVAHDASGIATVL